MFIKYLTLASLSIGLVACMETTDVAEVPTGTVISTEQAFLSTIAGKNLTFMDNNFTVNADGTISGPWDGSGITGTWEWRDGFWCRTVSIGGNARPEDCQLWVVSGNIATVTRDRGNGPGFDYIIS